MEPNWSVAPWTDISQRFCICHTGLLHKMKYIGGGGVARESIAQYTSITIKTTVITNHLVTKDYHGMHYP